MRQISPRAVDLIARKLEHQPERVLLHTVASAARENLHARRAADRVKVDYADDTTTPSERRNDKIFAAPQLRKSDALLALLDDAGPYAAAARAAGHAVPGDATLDPAHREPLAWNGLLDGFADKLRVLEPHVVEPQLGHVLESVATRLDDQYKNKHSITLSYTKKKK